MEAKEVKKDIETKNYIQERRSLFEAKAAAVPKPTALISPKSSEKLPSKTTPDQKSTSFVSKTPESKDAAPKSIPLVIPKSSEKKKNADRPNLKEIDSSTDEDEASSVPQPSRHRVMGNINLFGKSSKPIDTDEPEWSQVKQSMQTQTRVCLWPE